MIARGQCLCLENLYLKGLNGLYWKHDSCIFMDTDNEEILFKVISTSWH